MKNDNSLKLTLIIASSTIIAAIINLYQPFMAKWASSDKTKQDILDITNKKQTNKYSIVKNNTYVLLDINTLNISRVNQIPKNIYLTFKKEVNINNHNHVFFEKMYSGDYVNPKSRKSIIISATIIKSNKVKKIKTNDFFSIVEANKNGNFIIEDFEKNKINILYGIKSYSKDLNDKYLNSDIFNTLDIRIISDYFKFHAKTI